LTDVSVVIFMEENLLLKKFILVADSILKLLFNAILSRVARIYCNMSAKDSFFL